VLCILINVANIANVTVAGGFRSFNTIPSILMGFPCRFLATLILVDNVAIKVNKAIRGP